MDIIPIVQKLNLKLNKRDDNKIIFKKINGNNFTFVSKIIIIIFLKLNLCSKLPTKNL